MAKIILKNKLVWIFLAILVVGIVFRTYNFSDWLRFNMDQSRDTILIEKAIAENKLPELGPKAGGTDFKIGPAFYQIQFISAKIFGTDPEKLAYPDLLFSILSIILIFLLARIYFKNPVALSISWLYAISFFVVKYSRFAWNPNSAPFFVMLYIYSLYQVVNSKKKKLVWAALVGIALGICIQLHTSLLAILPIVSIIMAFILLKNKQIKVKAILVILAAFILVNIPQIVGEIKTGGSNTKNLITGTAEKSERNDGFGENLLLNVACHINSTGVIVSSRGSEFNCDYNYAWKTFKKLDGKRMTILEKASFVVLSIMSLALFFGGYFLFFRKVFTEKTGPKKIILQLLFLYTTISFIFYTVWANELAVRFFLPLSFVPFLILGFWLDFLSTRFKKGIIIVLIIIAALSIFHLRKDSHTFRYLKYGGEHVESDFSYMTLGEGKYIIDFIKSNSDKKENYIYSKARYLFKSFRPIRFLGEKEQLEIVKLRGPDIPNINERIFYFNSSERGCNLTEKKLERFSVEKCVLFRQFAIFSLVVKQ